MIAGNLFSVAACGLGAEHVSALIATEQVRIERIVSRAYASPPGFWYDQEFAEWVVVLAGSAGIEFAGEKEPRTLAAGDYLGIPAHVRHRIAWTAVDRETVWLAVHYR